MNDHVHPFPLQFQNRKQWLQFGFVILCIVCLLPSRLFLKSGRFSVFQKKNTRMKTRHATTAINATAECRYFSQALSQFTNALQDRPEETALRPWMRKNTASKYPTWHFPGLSSQLLESAFHAKRIALVGDSTLFGMFRWMQTLLKNTTQNQLDALLQLDMTQGNYLVNPEGLHDCGWANTTATEIQLQDGTHMMWHGHRGDALGEAVCHFDWQPIIQLQPHILVVNFGMHWLHLMGGGRNVPLCSIRHWLDYEVFLQQVMDMALQANVRLLLFKTTNYICTDHFWGDYSDAVSLLQRQDAYALSRCKRQIQRLLEHHHHDTGLLSENDMDRYCTKGVLDEFGVKDLNHRLLEFVHSHQSSTTRMAIYNDHDLESCQYSEPNDGRHYPPLNLMRIRLLANMIQCLYE